MAASCEPAPILGLIHRLAAAPWCPAGPPIHHFDLYRLTEGYDLARLDLPASFSQVDG